MPGPASFLGAPFLFPLRTCCLLQRPLQHLHRQEVGAGDLRRHAGLRRRPHQPLLVLEQQAQQLGMARRQLHRVHRGGGLAVVQLQGICHVATAAAGGRGGACLCWGGRACPCASHRPEAAALQLKKILHPVCCCRASRGTLGHLLTAAAGSRPGGSARLLFACLLPWCRLW